MALEDCLRALDAGIDAAARLGLDPGPARETRERIERRSGYPGDAYVLALVGGTGVGKSSLLNALAGSEVSAAGVRRPTTGDPIAWVPRERAGAVASLLEWLGSPEVRTHDRPELASVVVLDLPDLDSVEPAHRARVDRTLPRVDAVLWVTDPEKYQDAVLHDAYLRAWVPRLDRQALVLNKVDRVGVGDARRLREHLRAGLPREGLPELPVLLASAAPADGAAADVASVLDWLAGGIEAKAVVGRRLAVEARAAVRSMADAAGLREGSDPRLVREAARSDAARRVLAEVLRVVDLDGASHQAVEATKLAARPRGGGPLGIARALLERTTGVSERRADPAGYLRRWRDRGSLVAATAPLRELVAGAMTGVPAGGRPALAPLAATGEVVTSLATAVDRAVTLGPQEARPPVSRIWPVFGVLQLVATAAVLLGVLWIVAGAGGVPGGVPGVDAPASVTVPILGPVPTPVLLVVGGVAAWWLLGRLLGIHAGWLGRRWARRIRGRLAEAVEREVVGTALGPLERVETARRELAQAVGAAGVCEG